MNKENINTDDLPGLPDASHITGMLITAGVMGIIGIALLLA